MKTAVQRSAAIALLASGDRVARRGVRHGSIPGQEARGQDLVLVLGDEASRRWPAGA